MNSGIMPILCIGETRVEHDAGEAEKIVQKQLEIAFSLITKPYTLTPIIAYEPIWAISTEPGTTPDTPENAVKMIQYIKSLVGSEYTPNLIYVYGGSVNAHNAESFLREKDIEGALVGGASLAEESIKKIIEVAERY